MDRSFGDAPVPSANCLIGVVLPRLAVLTTPSVKSAYRISGTVGPPAPAERLIAPVLEHEIAIAFGVLPVGETCWIVIGFVRNGSPGVIAEMLNTVYVFAEEFVTV